jgi:endo-1,4-beta-xylanase
MKTKIVFKWVLLAVLAIVFSGCKNPGPSEPVSGGGNEPTKPTEPVEPPAVPVTGFSLGKGSTTLTLYSSEQLTWTITPADASYQTITWTSSAPNVAAVDANGKITAAGVTNSLTEKYTVAPATGTAVITGTTVEGKTASITVNTTVRPQAAAVDSLPAMKDQFKDYFMMGNIAGNANDINGTGTTAARLKRHYNILTAENVMKPSYLTTGRNASNGTITYAWTTNANNNPDNFVNACASNNFKVHGHVLLWHSQNPNWMWEQIASKNGTIASGMDKAKALDIMKKYITEVMTHFKGKVYSWDVLNEAFPDNAGSSVNWKDAIRKNASGEGQDANPWYIAIGSDFVYEAFLAARLADPAAILYYNDYNTDMSNRARLIRDMVKEVNDKYSALPSGSKPSGDPAGRLLIEGIGMQEHHNTNVTAASIRTTINLFRPLGVKLSVSELDVLCQPYNGDGGYTTNPAANNNPETANNTVTNNGFIKAAQLYGEYMKLYIENKDIIERVSLWGVIDSQSWRGKGLPLIFDKDGKAKPAYYKIIEALE